MAMQNRLGKVETGTNTTAREVGSRRRLLAPNFSPLAYIHFKLGITVTQFQLFLFTLAQLEVLNLSVSLDNLQLCSKDKKSAEFKDGHCPTQKYSCNKAVKGWNGNMSMVTVAGMSQSQDGLWFQ